MSENKRLQKLERSVAQIEKDIGRLQSSQGKQDRASVRQQNYAEQQGQPAPFSVLVEPTPSDSNNSGKRAQRRKRPLEWLARNWKPTLEVLGVFAAIVYAGITYFQWRDLRHNFEVEERAWMKIDPLYPAEIPRDGSMQIRISNIGKSAAADVEIDNWIDVLPHSEEPSFNEATANSKIITSLIFPGSDDVSPISRVNKQSKTAAEPRIGIDDGDQSLLQTGDSYMIVWGHISYRDQFGLHWTRFCKWKQYGGDTGGHGYNASQCASYNAVGDGRYTPKNN